jgi:glycosyltransferase involved in cell wall biosynthesis
MHNLYPHDHSSIPGLDKFARRTMVRLATNIFVHGPTAAAIVKKEFSIPERKLSTIQHGNWIDFYPADMPKDVARSKLGLDEDSHVFLFIGSCKGYKGLPGLLRNFSQIDSRAKLVIAGRFDDPDYYAEVVGLAEAIPGNRVRIDSGYIHHDEMQIYLNACDAVVLPYLEILTSGATVLALGFGRPVIAPRKGHPQDIIDDTNGILYDPDETGALAAAMSLMMERSYDADHIRNQARSLTWDSAVEALRASMSTGRTSTEQLVRPKASFRRSGG